MRKFSTLFDLLPRSNTRLLGVREKPTLVGLSHSDFAHTPHAARGSREPAGDGDTTYTKPQPSDWSSLDLGAQTCDFEDCAGSKTSDERSIVRVGCEQAQRARSTAGQTLRRSSARAVVRREWAHLSCRTRCHRPRSRRQRRTHRTRTLLHQRLNRHTDRHQQSVSA